MISFEELYNLEVNENIALQRRCNDIEKKMKIARNILKVCESEAKEGPKALQYKSKAAMYIGEDFKYITSFVKKATFGVTFRNLVDILTDDKKTLLHRNVYEYTRTIILENYLFKQRVPTLYDIQNKYTKKEYTKPLFNGKKLIDKNNMTCMILKKCGFIFQQLPRTNKCMIVEDPEQVFTRQRYLRKIKKYREEGRYIVYIEDRLMWEISTLGAQKYMVFAASSKEGLISSVIFHKAATNNEMSFHEMSFHEQYLRVWLIDIILPTLYPNSVLVFEDKEHHDKNICALPTETSSKREIIAFLDENNIPHDPTMHRASLLNLVRKMKKSCCLEKYPLTEFIRNRGFEILRRPKGLPSLDIFEPIWGHFIMQGKSSKIMFKELSAAARLCTPVEWKDNENKLAENEEAFYKDDIKLELVIDKIMTLAKHNGISNNELKQFYQDYSKENYIVDDIIVM